jgi:integrase
MLCLLLDHGLRVGEVAGLAVSNLDVEAGLMSFYRPKVDIEQIHRLTADTLEAARAYLGQDALPAGPLLRRNRRGGGLGKARVQNPAVGGILPRQKPGSWLLPMTDRGITGQVRRLGERIGIDGLSAHDLRHFWATQAARNGTPLDRLQDAGGWASPKMPLRYVERTRIANEGVRLGD